MFKRSGDGKGKWYVHNPQDKKKLDIIDKETADRLKKEAGEGGNVIITTFLFIMVESFLFIIIKSV